MDPALKYSARVVKTSWFMLRKWKMLYFNLWDFLVKMCCYREKYIYIYNKRLHPHNLCKKHMTNVHLSEKKH